MASNDTLVAGHNTCNLSEKAYLIFEGNIRKLLTETLALPLKHMASYVLWHGVFSATIALTKIVSSSRIVNIFFALIVSKAVRAANSCACGTHAL